MFTESLLESSGLQQRTRRGWTTAASLAMQVAVIGALALIPMLYPEALSLVRKPPEIPIFSAPAPPPVTPIAHAATTAPTSTSTVTFIHSDHTVTFGQVRPAGPAGIEPAAPDPNHLGLRGSGQLNLGSATPPVTRDVPQQHPFRLSQADPASLIHYVKPLYPSIAINSHTQGVVTLHALISKEGAVESLQLISGHPFLAPAALNAVKQWRYRPYILNGEAVEVETQITVNFTLGNN